MADEGVHSFMGGFGVSGLPHSIAKAMMMTNSGFTNAMLVFDEILLGGGYIKIAGPASNEIKCVPYTNAGYTSKWLNLVQSIINFAQ
jgi:hypothetical protein